MYKEIYFIVVPRSGNHSIGQWLELHGILHKKNKDDILNIVLLRDLYNWLASWIISVRKWFRGDIKNRLNTKLIRWREIANLVLNRWSLALEDKLFIEIIKENPDLVKLNEQILGIRMPSEIQKRVSLL